MKSENTSVTTGLEVGANPDAAYRMSCMEIWGGNTSVGTPVALPGLTGWVHSKPVEPAVEGGDVYYLSVCSAGLLSRIVLADVAGHGQAVGGAAVILRDLLRHHVNAFDQSELMRGINDAFARPHPIAARSPARRDRPRFARRLATLSRRCQAFR